MTVSMPVRMSVIGIPLLMNFLALNYALHSSAMSVGCGEMMARSLLFEKHSWKVLRDSETMMFVRSRLLSESIRKQFTSNICVEFSGDV